MDKGSDSLTKFSVLDNKTSSNSDFLSSMKLHQTTVTEPFVRSGDGGGGGGGVVGPTYSSGGANEAAAGYMYRDEISPSDRRGAESFGRNTPILQPFDNFHASYSTSTSPYKYSVGGMAMGFPFTAAQWKELERQAMIYKCMISSVPVPPNLLFPPDFSVDSSLPMYGGRYCRKGDLEPGRCKRTDGKKWRCSREVAPQQKYCERHLHRGRPRSRKPVEANKSINGENQKKSHTKTLPTANDLKAKTDLTISTPYYKECNRGSCLMTGGGAASSKQPWENIGLSDYSSPSFDQDYAAAAAQPLNLFCYPNLPAPEMDLPTGFIDAWSIDHRSKGSVESSISLSEGDLSPSLNLSMAMAVGTAFDDQIRNIQADHVTWGPLGEALQPGSAAVGGSNPASPYNSISTAATTVSSPSGVLHWTLFSHSDGSVCNSPTFAAAAAPEISNQWHI